MHIYTNLRTGKICVNFAMSLFLFSLIRCVMIDLKIENIIYEWFNY